MIGGSTGWSGAWVGAFVFAALDNYTRGLDIVGQRFNTVVGAIFRHRPRVAWDSATG